MRKRLLLFLKILLAVNLFSAVCFFCTVLYYRKRNNAIQESYLSLSLLNRTLLEACRHQYGVVSNLVSSFSAARINSPTNFVPSSVSSVSSVVSSVSSSAPSMPEDFGFTGYHVVDGDPAVMIGIKTYHENDFILGFKIECITPSIVRVAGKYYPVK